MKSYLKMKRILDLIFAVTLLVVVSPIMLLAAIAIKVEDKNGPVLFKQQRPGKGAKLFTIYKFRTMYVKNVENGRQLSDMERMTKVGAILRKTSVDELPQIINVLLGEMSFIGPRPLLVQYLEFYSTEQMRRHEVLPGISGWAQVNGRNTVSWEEKFNCDIWYVDIRILYMTLKNVFLGRNVNQSDSDTMEDFRGSNLYKTEKGRVI